MLNSKKYCTITNAILCKENIMDVLMFILKWILMIPVMWGLMFISIFFHEVGHLIMYLLFYRENNWRIELGAKGKKYLKLEDSLFI